MRLFLLFFSLLAATPAPAPRATSAVAPSAKPAPSANSPDALFSRRALRRAKLLIQMRVMQLREERLECIRAALLRRLPDALWPEEPSPSRGSSDARRATEHCEELLNF